MIFKNISSYNCYNQQLAVGEHKTMQQPASTHNPQKDNLSTILSLYTSKTHLTKHSLFNNLFSSQPLNLSSPDKQFMKLYFAKQSIQQNELYEFTYFHKRDKKMLLYFFILNFLRHVQKVEMVVYENGDRVNGLELREFLAREDIGGGPALLRMFEARVSFFRAETHQVYKLNLHYLPFYLQKNQFLKVVILSDINQFQSGDKSSLQRIYKKIPKNLLVLSFKKQIYDYKFIQKSTMPFLLQLQLQADQISQHYELHEKVTRNINKSIEGFKVSHHSYIVPIEQIGIANKSLEESYRSVIIRKDGDGMLSQYIFTSYPFEVKAYRKIQ